MSVMSDSLPEDLQLLSLKPGGRPRNIIPMVSFIESGLVLNRAAFALINEPDRVDVFVGKQSKMIALRPSEIGHRCTKQGRSGSVRVGLRRVLREVGLSLGEVGNPLRLKARLVEGALLIGPVPIGAETPS